MESTLEALRLILIKSLPTVGLLILLHAFLRLMLFKPLEKVLRDRHAATEGARAAAAQTVGLAEQKTAELEAKLQAARADLYRSQEESRQRLLADQEAAVARARQESRDQVEAAQEALARDAALARQSLAAEAEQLAAQIAGRVLGRRAA